MTKNMKKFMEALSEHPELGDKVAEAGKKELVAIAKALGIALADADFENPVVELSEDELGTVAGGGVCACVLGGGGTEDKSDKTCACILGGGGEDRNGWTRCVCIMAGNGRDNRAMED